jgi:hypothetical protein
MNRSGLSDPAKLLISSDQMLKPMILKQKNPSPCRAGFPAQAIMICEALWNLVRRPTDAIRIVNNFKPARIKSLMIFLTLRA